MENDENHIYGVTRSHFLGFVLFWFCLGVLSIYLFFVSNEGKISKVIESNWPWIFLAWYFYAYVLASSIKERMKNANMEDNISFLCYFPFLGIIAIIDGLQYPTNPFYKRPSDEEIEALKNKKYLLRSRIKLIDETQQYFNNCRAYLQFRNIEEIYNIEFDGMFHSFNPDIENDNALVKHIKILENQIASKELFFRNYVAKSCEHGIPYGYLSPNKCPKCWACFFEWIEETKKIEQKEIEKEKAITAEEKRQHLKSQRVLKKKQALDRYKKSFKGKMSSEEIGAAYERYIGYLYETEGFNVIYNGIIKGKKDDSVDIIATNKKEIYIIQCKWYKQDSQVHINTIRQFNDKFIELRKDNATKKVYAILATVYDNLDEEARERLLKTDIVHRVIPFDYEYPMIKCNINESNGEKIYHLPGVGQYDRIKINVKKNECYVYTIEEAETLGFREVE